MKRWTKATGLFLFLFFLSGLQVPSSLELPVLEATDLKLYNGKIYVLSHKLHKVFIYDLRGNLITSFGRKGQGPGEFVGAYRIFPDRDEIFVVDIAGHRVQVFDHSGNFKRTILLRTLTLPTVLIIGKSAFYMVQQVTGSGKKQVVVYRKDGGREKEIVALPPEPIRTKEFVFPPYSYPTISRVMDYLVLADLEKGTLKLYEVDGKLYRQFSARLPRYKISKKWKEMFFKKSKSALDMLKARGIKVKIREHFPLMRRVLPFGRCLAVEEWNEEAPYNYHFFTLEGKEVKKLSFPKPVYTFFPPYYLKVEHLDEGIKIDFVKVEVPECLPR